MQLVKFSAVILNLHDYDAIVQLVRPFSVSAIILVELVHCRSYRLLPRAFVCWLLHVPQKLHVRAERLGQVDAGKQVSRHARPRALEPAMRVQQVVAEPRDVSEAVDALHRRPGGVLEVVQVEGQDGCLAVVPAADNDRQVLRADHLMLISLAGAELRVGGVVGRADPVPLALRVPAQAPQVLERVVVARATAENQHHVDLVVGLPDGGGVVDAGGRRVLEVELGPEEGVFLDAERPDLVVRLVDDVSAHDNDVGLHEHHDVSVTGGGLGAFDGHREPLSVHLGLTHLEQVELVVDQLSVRLRPAENNHLKLLDGGGGVCCSRLWTLIGVLGFEQRPAIGVTVERVGIVGDFVSAFAHCSSKHDRAVF